VTGIVLVMLVLVAGNADGQDRVSARRGRAWRMGERVVWLVVLAVISGVLSVVVGAGISCIAGLRCAGTEHAVMDWGSCVCLVFSAWRLRSIMDMVVSCRVGVGSCRGWVGNGWWMNAC
jgi:hypothetical protein